MPHYDIIPHELDEMRFDEDFQLWVYCEFISSRRAIGSLFYEGRLFVSAWKALCDKATTDESND